MQRVKRLLYLAFCLPQYRIIKPHIYDPDRLSFGEVLQLVYLVKACVYSAGRPLRRRSPPRRLFARTQSVSHTRVAWGEETFVSTWTE